MTNVDNVPVELELAGIGGALPGVVVAIKLSV